MLLDECHVVGVLAGEERVVARDILEAIEHPHVGVHRLGGARWGEGGVAPEGSILLQKLDHRRRVVQQRRVHSGVETRAKGDEVQHQQPDHQELPHRSALSDVLSLSKGAVEGPAADEDRAAAHAQDDAGPGQ